MVRHVRLYIISYVILSKTCAIAGGPVSVAVGFYIVSFGSISEVDMVSVDAQLQLS